MGAAAAAGGGDAREAATAGVWDEAPNISAESLTVASGRCRCPGCWYRWCWTGGTKARPPGAAARRRRKRPAAGSAAMTRAALWVRVRRGREAAPPLEPVGWVGTSKKVLGAELLTRSCAFDERAASPSERLQVNHNDPCHTPHARARTQRRGRRLWLLPPRALPPLLRPPSPRAYTR